MSTNNAIDIEDYAGLGKIGMSKLEIICYATLYGQPYLNCKQLAARADRPLRSIHRCIKRLQHKGFVRRIYTGIHPYKYDAVLLNEALVSYAEWQYRAVSRIMSEQSIEQYERELKLLRSLKC